MRPMVRRAFDLLNRMRSRLDKLVLTDMIMLPDISLGWTASQA
jgi:hypothetical protein